MKIRQIKKTEYDVLGDFLYQAIFLPPCTDPLPREVINNPEIFIYIDNFGDKSDCALLRKKTAKLLERHGRGLFKHTGIGLNKAFPDRSEFRHSEGNSSAHLKASAIGSGATVIIEKGKLALGTWQGIYFCEFDPPRNRKFYVKVQGV